MRCVFCDFATGKRKEHANGLPFKPLRQTKNTLSFLSSVCPEEEDGHILVIPKKHYDSIEKVPAKTQHELIEHVSLLARVLRKKHDGCNILLNDGSAAGQTVFHMHFHLLPRDTGDKIKIEVFKRKKMTREAFAKMHATIKRNLR